MNDDAYSLLAEAQKALEIVRDNYGLQDHSLLARIAALLAKGPPCTKCGQVDHGQTGEYPCPVCGLPLTHDDSPPAETFLQRIYHAYPPGTPMPPAAPDGFVLVPKKMTPEMFKASILAEEVWRLDDDPHGRSYQEVMWDAMVRAVEGKR